MPRPKYQVFVSSTFRDLAEERREVMWQILRVRHIPAGMEWFPSTDDRGWKIIQRMIDQADYYVLLLAGRYGDVDETVGMSWTEREYHYAVEKGLPVLAFVRDPAAITANNTEPGQDGRDRLEDFIELIRSRHLVQNWREAADLGAVVSQSLHTHIMDDEESENQRPGWYRGTDIPAPGALETIERLRGEIERLRGQAEAGGASTSTDFQRLARYYARIEWGHNGEDVTLLSSLRQQAAELSVGLLPHNIGPHLCLHQLAEADENGRMSLTIAGHRFLSELALKSDDDLVFS